MARPGRAPLIAQFTSVATTGEQVAMIAAEIGPAK
jgi:hypothetical protein